MKKLLLVLVVLIFTITAYAAVRESAAYPGERLASQNDKTTAKTFYGVFYCLATSSGVGNIYIQRSEDNTNWVTVKIVNKPDTNSITKAFYEQFGDESIVGHPNTGKAYYRAILLDSPGLSSGSLRVRFAHWDLP